MIKRTLDIKLIKLQVEVLKIFYNNLINKKTHTKYASTSQKKIGNKYNKYYCK